jgi:PAS fold
MTIKAAHPTNSTFSVELPGIEPVGFDSSSAVLSASSPAKVVKRTGWFRFYFDDHRWVRSEQVQRPHGYEPGRVRPTTELVLSHKHPEDRGQVAATIDDITHNRGVFSSRHRIIDTKGVCAGWSSGTSSAMTTVW